MNVRDEQRGRVAEKLAAHLLAHGLSRSSLRQLAAAAGVSDRMLLYYFADKSEVLSASLERIATRVIDSLAQAFPEGQRFPVRELVLRAATVTGQPEMRGFMRLWIEVIAAASRGEAPFVDISGQIVLGFQNWIESRLALAEGKDRAGLALAIIGLIDGLALIDACIGEQAAQDAMSALPKLLSPELNPAKP